MRGAITLWKLELLRAAKAPVLIASTLATPLVWLVLFGTMFRDGVGVRFQGFDYLTFMAPGLMILMASLYALSSGTRTMADKQVGFLKEVLVAPVGRMEVIVGRALGICTIVTAQALIILGVPALLGEGPPVPYGALSIAGIAAAVSLVALGFTGLGMMMATQGKNPQSFAAAIGALTLPMFFLSGALVPIANLPAWARGLATVNPMAYAVDLTRQAALGTGVGHFPLALAALGLLGFALVALSAGAKHLRAE
ncbi:MAG TPA: ABC transporter permease [Candidatus Thermoplasmatota archaeon]|jgi:ABC-2 type transport system permease protein|nr:ABC transporter permease [Candidatus Thermoplasmatota archaeon]